MINLDDLTTKEIVDHMGNLTKLASWEVYKAIIIRDEIEPLKEMLLTKKFERIEDVYAAQERLSLVENLIYTPEVEIINLKTEDERN